MRIDHQGYKRNDSQYKTYDQITDNVVIVCVDVILAVMSTLTPTRIGSKKVLLDPAATGVTTDGRVVEPKASRGSDDV